MKVIKLAERTEGFEWLVKEMEAIHNEEGIDTMICIYKKKNNMVGFGTTRGNNAEILGLIEMGKVQLIDELYRDD